jgi:hypothetical protein
MCLCQPPPKFHHLLTCAALLNTGVGAPLFHDANTISSRLFFSRSVPAICLFMLSDFGGPRVAWRVWVEEGESQGRSSDRPAAALHGQRKPSPFYTHSSTSTPAPSTPTHATSTRTHYTHALRTHELQARLTEVGLVVLAVVELQGGLAHVGLEGVLGVGQRLELERGTHDDGAARGLWGVSVWRWVRQGRRVRRRG